MCTLQIPFALHLAIYLHVCVRRTGKKRQHNQKNMELKWMAFETCVNVWDRYLSVKLSTIHVLNINRKYVPSFDFRDFRRIDNRKRGFKQTLQKNQRKHALDWLKLKFQFFPLLISSTGMFFSFEKCDGFVTDNEWENHISKSQALKKENLLFPTHFLWM